MRPRMITANPIAPLLPTPSISDKSEIMSVATRYE